MAKPVPLSDTVGLIRQLPHTLVAAFRATLEEAIQADVLLHVVDSASATRDAHIAAVNAVLAEIGADHIPQILVYNKIDLNGYAPRIERDEYGKIRQPLDPALKPGTGLDELTRAALEEYSRRRKPTLSLSVARQQHTDPGEHDYVLAYFP